MRKVVLSLALVLLGVAQANADFTISSGAADHQYPLGTTVVTIPISIVGPDALTQTNINVSIVPLSASPGDFGSAGTPTIGFVGQNVAVPNNGDVVNNFMSATAHLFGDSGTDSWNIFVFENLANPAAPINVGPPGNTSAGANILINLTVDFTGFNAAPGSWRIVMGADNGNGATDFANVVTPIAATIPNFTVTLVPEPSSIALGLFAATGLGVVALRKRRARRA